MDSKTNQVQNENNYSMSSLSCFEATAGTPFQNTRGPENACFSTVSSDINNEIASLNSTPHKDLEKYTQEADFTRHSSEIKEEILQNYSVDAWCELGPSIHEFGQNPDQSDGIDLKDEIEKNPGGDPDSHYLNNSNVIRQQSEAFQIKPVSFHNVDSIPFDSSMVSVSGEKIVSGDIIISRGLSTSKNKQRECSNTDAENQMSPYNTRRNNKVRHMNDNENEDKNRDLNLKDVRISKSEILSKREDIQEMDNNENKDPLMNLKITDTSKIQLNTQSLQHFRTAGQVDIASSSSIIRNSNLALQPGSKIFHPIPIISQYNNSSTFNTFQTVLPVQKQQVAYQNSQPYFTNNSISTTPASNSIQSSSEYPVPFFANNFMSFRKENDIRESFKSSNDSQYCLQNLVTSPQQYFSTSFENSCVYQTWVKPNPAGYFHCPFSPSVFSGNSNKTSNNKMLVLTPHTMFLQQLPFMSLFQQPSFNPLVAAVSSHPTKDRRHAPDIASTNLSSISNRDQSIHDVSTSSKESFNIMVFDLEATSIIKSTDGAPTGSEPLDLDSNIQRKENITGIRYPEKQGSSVFGHELRKNTDKNQAIGSPELKQKHSKTESKKSFTDAPSKGYNADGMIADFHTVVGGNDENCWKGRAQEMVMPKMSSGKDYVDPTRLKLDQEDELGDNALFNENNTSDEDWLPEKRDGDKSEDSESDNDLILDEEDKEEELRFGGIKLKRQRKLQNSKGQKQLNENNNKTLSCHYCKKVFHGNYHLKRHLLSHTENRPHQCNTCGKRFKQKAHLHGHEIVHLREKSKPQKDNKSSSNVGNKLNSSSPHKCPGRPKKVYSEKELSCNVCNKVFKTLYRLKRHVQSHTDIRPYTCKVCGKGFKQTGHRNEHEANHEKNRRKFLCNICGVIFHCRSSFNNHLKTHRSNKVFGDKGRPDDANDIVGKGTDGAEVQHTGYDCPYCTDKFATAQGLNRHLDSHVEVRQRLHVQPYSCQVCSRSFTYKHNLAKHKLTHQAPEKFAEFHKSKLKEHLASGRPSYTCAVCSKVFMRKETLAKHSKVHTGNKPFKCEVCQKEFTQNVHLKVHMRKHTGSRPFQCKRCNVGFIDSTALAKHIEYEACISENMLFHCTICDKRHYYLGSIKQHIKKEHNEKDVDNFISRTARQRRSRASNASTESTCKICSKPFSERVYLIRHVKRKHGDLLKLLDRDLKRGSSGNVASHSHYERINRLSSETVHSEKVVLNPQVSYFHNDQDAQTVRSNYSSYRDDNPTVSNGSRILRNNQTKKSDHVKINNQSQPLDKEKENHTRRDITPVNDDEPNTYQKNADAVQDALSDINDKNSHSALQYFVPNLSISKVNVDLDVLARNGNFEEGGLFNTTECPVNIHHDLCEMANDPVEVGQSYEKNKCKVNSVSVRDEERDERITESNVNRFLYHVGLVEKSKASNSKCSNDPSCCNKDSNSCSMPSCDLNYIQNSSDNCSGYYSEYQTTNTTVSQIKDRSEGFQNLSKNVFRSNLEVFCDLALMTENRLDSSKMDSTRISGSTYFNEFQNILKRHQNQATDINSDSSVTEAQLKELGLAVCKDAQVMRNKQRSAEDLYTEFKPWLEQLVRPSTAQSLIFCSKKVAPTALPDPCDVETNESSKTAPRHHYKDQKIDTDSNRSLSANYHRPCVGNDPVTYSISQSPHSSTVTNDNLSSMCNLNHVAVTSVPGSWTSNTSPLYGISNVRISSTNFVQTIRLKEQLQRRTEDNSNILATSNSFKQSSFIPSSNDGKESSAQTQTPIHFDSISTGICASHSSKEISTHQPSPTENSAYFLQGSNILHSLLGGVSQFKAISPNNYINDSKGNETDNSHLPTTVIPLVSNSTTERRSRFFSKNIDEECSAPSLQLVTKSRLPTSSTTVQAAKSKGPFPCQGCGKCFNARHQLKRHEMTHTEVRPYRCAECGKAFRQKVHLSDHLKRHRGQRPFLCTICGKRFVLKNELKQHTKNYCRKAPSIVSS